MYIIGCLYPKSLHYFRPLMVWTDYSHQSKACFHTSYLSPSTNAFVNRRLVREAECVHFSLPTRVAVDYMVSGGLTYLWFLPTTIYPYQFSTHCTAKLDFTFNHIAEYVSVIRLHACVSWWLLIHGTVALSQSSTERESEPDCRLHSHGLGRVFCLLAGALNPVCRLPLGLLDEKRCCIRRKLQIVRINFAAGLKCIVVVSWHSEQLFRNAFMKHIQFTFPWCCTWG